MTREITLKVLYNLKKDTSEFQSSLVTWYNTVIDKSCDELNVRDVSLLIRQKILPDFAVDKAIEILLNDPFVGELSDGDLLVTLVCALQQSDVIRNENHKLLEKIIRLSDEKSNEFEWANDLSKEKYFENISKLRKIL